MSDSMEVCVCIQISKVSCCVHMYSQNAWDSDSKCVSDFFFLETKSCFSIWGMTPPPAIVALTSRSNSSSPRIANCKWRGVIRFTFKSFEAFPASSRTSAVKSGQTVSFKSFNTGYKSIHSKMAEVYTAAVAPTRIWWVALRLRKRWIRPTGN